MEPKLRDNFLRLLRPRHVAVFGGADAETVITECRRIGYTGTIWPVNPRRAELCGLKTFRHARDLPAAPDASYLAIPREAAVDVVGELRALGAGGAVCYTAGFSETGPSGRALEQTLIAAAGELAVVGPNCYGFVNYVDRVALWPFAHGATTGTRHGVAIITQSGMLSSNITMAQRSLPLSYMISTGNQAVLRLEDCIDVLIDIPDVRVIGLHIEGIRDIAKFERVAARALQAQIPIVALKLGRSAIGSRITVTHTDSLAGTDELYDALFRHLNIIRVSSPTRLLETVKYLAISDAPQGSRLAAFTCSGADATMIADYAAAYRVSLPQPSTSTVAELRTRLPAVATPSNPLDYTTPIWGDRDRLPPVFTSALRDQYDAALLVQDYSQPGLDNSEEQYRNDAQSFIAATQAAQLPAAICSTLPENFPAHIRDWLSGEGVTPLQGIQDAVWSIAAAMRYAKSRMAMAACGNLESRAPRFRQQLGVAATIVDEATTKQILAQHGLAIPKGIVTERTGVADAATAIGFPVVLKLIQPSFEHKTEHGLIALGLSDERAVHQATEQMYRRAVELQPDGAAVVFLVEEMIGDVVAELLIGIRNDAEFGLTMTLATGGVFTELQGDATTLLLPAWEYEIEHALQALRCHPQLMGFRNRPGCDLQQLRQTLRSLAAFAVQHQAALVDLEINPLLVGTATAHIGDAVMHACPARFAVNIDGDPTPASSSGAPAHEVKATAPNHAIATSRNSS